ncbi:hypothetical protein OG342_03805 [Streptomyces bobili]|uniref:hypothetical protein n=1 Tax=Streptomyces bobili TaxID=67280 RepID=UPI0022594847|nr:hypothetical protein [Streptomyces bobili]MCX5521994.1 hypothetical protein [Streptomyces bobili]
MMSKLGGGALALFCYVDVITCLAIGDWISDVGPLLLYGAPTAFVTGSVAAAVHGAHLRKAERDAGR